jgi:hypothetical protein
VVEDTSSVEIRMFGNEEQQIEVLNCQYRKMYFVAENYAG